MFLTLMGGKAELTSGLDKFMKATLAFNPLFTIQETFLDDFRFLDTTDRTEGVVGGLDRFIELDIIA
jgi:hypothetical protein